MSKTPLKIVIIGHVDHGKSTLVGQILASSNSIEKNRIDALKKSCEAQGKKFEFAFLLDALEEEQDQGVTIDLVRVPFQTKKRAYQIIDAPGHKEFLKNMISGAAGADAAVLLIDAKEGVCEQSIRHGRIISVLGINQTIVLVNKMDLVNYSQKQFAKVKKEYSKYLEKISVKPLEFIPVSAFENENIIKKSSKMPWNAGNDFISSIDSFKNPKSPLAKPFRMSVQDVYKFDDRRIIAGKVLSGKLKIGDKIKFFPAEKEQTVKSFEAWGRDKKIKEIKAGDSVGITLKNQIFVERGEICAKTSQAPRVAAHLRANIIWMGNSHLQKGKKYKLKLAAQETACSLLSIEKLIDSSSLNLGDKYGSEAAKNEIAQVVFSLDNKIAFDAFSKISQTGRFVLFDEYQMSGGGIITEDQEINPDFSI